MARNWNSRQADKNRSMTVITSSGSREYLQGMTRKAAKEIRAIHEAQGSKVVNGIRPAVKK